MATVTDECLATTAKIGRALQKISKTFSVDAGTLGTAATTENTTLTDVFEIDFTTIANGGTGRIVAIDVIETKPTSGNVKTLDTKLFISGKTFTSAKGGEFAPTITLADADAIASIVHLDGNNRTAIPNWVSTTNFAFQHTDDMNLFFKTQSDTKVLYAQLLSKTSGTFAAGSSLILHFWIEKD